MPSITIEEYIQQRVDNQQDYYSMAAKKAKRNFQVLKAVEITLAALVPFLAASMGPGSMHYMKILVGAIGVTVTILSGMLMLFKFNENWVTYRGTAEALKSEKYYFLSHAGPYKGKHAKALFIERIERILGEENQKWQSYVMQQNDQESEAPLAEQPAPIAAEAEASLPPTTIPPNQ